jgi:hypothetical protein
LTQIGRFEEQLNELHENDADFADKLYFIWHVSAFGSSHGVAIGGV